MNDNNASMEMPRYICSKEVWALKIFDIDDQDDGSAIIHPAEKAYSAFPVSAEYVSKHEPQIGGYYVTYKGGYKSFSPADAFESGYSLIE